MLSLIFYLFFLIFVITYMNWYIFFISMILIMLKLILGCNFMVFYNLLSYGFGGDVLSLTLIILSIWITSLMIISSLSIYSSGVFINDFFLVILFLLIFLVLSFSCSSLFIFYIFFECVLIPTVFLIFGWGYQPERLLAGYYLLFYTLFFSLPFLLGIFYIHFYSFTTNYFLILVEENIYLYLSMLMAFLVKMPMIYVHFWLPKAHVEAPISGSMILAGVLLKLGGYGILRVFNFLSVMYLNNFFISLSLWGMFMLGLLCLFQLDMKILIAYSSVCHMSMVVCGLMSLSYWGLVGSLVLMVGHGLCSSGMFCLANICYERSGSRLLVLNKGLINYMPSMSMFWFLICINNMSSPPSLNLLGELIIFNGVVSWGSFSMFFLMFACFISCAYSIYMFSFLVHGSFYSGSFSSGGGYMIEYMLIFMHLLPLNLLFMSVDVFSLFLL